MSHTKKKHPRKTQEPEGGSLSFLFKNGAWGAGVSLLVAALLLFVGSALCLATEDPHAFTTPIGLIALYLSALVGGIVTMRRHKKAVLLCGLTCGILLTAFFLLLSIFLPNTSVFSLPLSLGLRALLPVFSILGALIGAQRSSPKRRRHR